MDDLRSLTRRFPRAGRLEAIYLRPGRDRAAVSVPSAQALVDRGLEGDRSAAKPATRPGGGKRQVTLIQAEHVPLIGLWTQRDVDAADLRRNLSSPASTCSPSTACSPTSRCRCASAPTC